MEARIIFNKTDSEVIHENVPLPLSMLDICMEARNALFENFKIKNLEELWRLKNKKLSIILDCEIIRKIKSFKQKIKSKLKSIKLSRKDFKKCKHIQIIMFALKKFFKAPERSIEAKLRIS